MNFRSHLAALVALFFTIAFANTGYAASRRTKPVRRVPERNVQKVCYTYISGSATLQPCSRMNGPAPTTVIPMVVIRYR